MDLELFMRYNKFADFYRLNNPNIYFFLKDCGFQRLYKENGMRYPNLESQNMSNVFQMEMKKQQWNRNKMTVKEYRKFLDDFFKKIDFNSIDLEACQLSKLIIENIGIFGPFDELTTNRIIYLEEKIEKLKAMKPIKTPIWGPFGNNNAPSYSSHFTDSKGLPESKSNRKNKSDNEVEIARLNEKMKQQKLNSPINPNNIPNDINMNFKKIIDQINDEKNKNQKLVDENNNLKNAIIEEKNKNQILTDENNNLNKKINDLNNEIEKLKNRNITLENKLEQKNLEIEKYTSQINEDKNIITATKLGQKIMTVNFVSMGNNDIGHYSLPCKQTDLFVRLEERLYENFPVFKDYETFFEVRTKRIKRFKTLEENNIKSNDIINIFVIDN